MTNEGFSLFPCNTTFMKMNSCCTDLVYAFLLEKHWEDEDGWKLCSHKDVNGVTCRDYIQEKSGVHHNRSTYQEALMILTDMGLIRKSYYRKRLFWYLTEHEGGEYVAINNEVLRFLVQSGIPRILRAYVYFKKKWIQYLYYKDKKYLAFSWMKLRLAIGYHNLHHVEQKDVSVKMLKFLTDNNLISYVPMKQKFFSQFVLTGVYGRDSVKGKLLKW